MKKINRFLSLLLAAVLVLGMIPAPVLAVRESCDTRRVVQINPHYAHLFTEEEVLAAIPEWTPGTIRPQGITYLDLESAAQVVREGMAQRNEAIQVSWYTTTEDFNEASHELMALVLSHTGDPKYGDSLMWSHGWWYTDLSRIREGGVYKFSGTVHASYYSTAAQEEELDRAVEELLEELDLEGKTDYEKIYAVYDYICSNVTYDYEHLEDDDYMLMFTAYAALINKTSVCQGYALLFYRLMLELGIDCRFIGGWGGGPHGWNIVELDGLYYNVDSTWDAGYSYYWWDYFLNSFWDFLDHERDMEYDTIAFHNEYPIAAESYESGVEAEMDPYIFAGYADENGNSIWYLNRNATLEIRGTGNCYDYASDEVPYYSYWGDEITGLWIDEGITGLGTNSFRDLYALTTIRFTGDAPAIASNAFSGVTATAYYPGGNATWTDDVMQNYGGNLTWVVEGEEVPERNKCGDDAYWTFENGTLTISGTGSTDDYRELVNDLDVMYSRPWDAFREEIRHVVIEEGITRLGNDAFMDHLHVQSVELPSTLKHIGTFVFWGCESLERIELPEGLTALGQQCFFNAALTEVEIPSTVTFVDAGVFENCKALTDVNFRSDPDLPSFTMGNSVFRGCTALEEIRVEDGHLGLRAIDGALYFRWDSGAMALNSYPIGRKNTEVRIADDTVIIDQFSFERQPWLQSVILPDTVTTVANSAFMECSSLTTVKFEGSAPEIQQNAFYNCHITVHYPAGDESWEIRHSWDEETICGSNGSIDYVAYIPEHDHDYQTVTTAPTCEDKGYTTYTCTICGDSYIADYTDALGHDMGDWVIVKAPTCTEDGAERSTCSRCDFHEDRVTEALGHDHKAAVTAPTCEEKGYTTYTCSCGDSYIDDYTDALGHDWDEGVVTIEPTEESEGEKLYTCKRCAHTRTEILPELDHTHSYESVVTAPTCEDKGYTTYTCSCGDSYVDDYTDALCHDMGDWVTVQAPTCTEAGTERSTCSRCGHTEDRVIEARGHDHKAVVTAPTCENKGYTTYTCSCGDSYVDDYTDALGHDMDDWVTVQAPTCTETGTDRRTCSRCGHTEERAVEALGHDYADGSCTRCGEKHNPFTDVPEKEYYYEPVLWAVSKGITNGYTATTFNPDGNCTRAQVVTFLWRAAGKPAPTATSHPFTDLEEDEYYMDAVLWAVEKGITNGYTADTFNPDGECTRAQVVTFLHRAANKPQPTATSHPFTDLDEDEYYMDAVLWAVEKGITNGYTADTFLPDGVCTRGQVVTFLYRTYNEKAN